MRDIYLGWKQWSGSTLVFMIPHLFWWGYSIGNSLFRLGWAGSLVTLSKYTDIGDDNHNLNQGVFVSNSQFRMTRMLYTKSNWPNYCNLWNKRWKCWDTSGCFLFWRIDKERNGNIIRPMPVQVEAVVKRNLTRLAWLSIFRVPTSHLKVKLRSRSKYNFVNFDSKITAAGLQSENL